MLKPSRERARIRSVVSLPQFAFDAGFAWPMRDRAAGEAWAGRGIHRVQCGHIRGDDGEASPVPGALCAGVSPGRQCMSGLGRADDNGFPTCLSQ